MTATLNNGSLHKCPMCKSVHRLTQCPIFKNEGMESRLDFVNTHNLCYICLLDNHVTNDCLSKRSCAICDESWHNTLLHQNSSTAAVVCNNNIVVSDLNDSQRINLSRVNATESIPVPRVQIDLDQLKHFDGVTPGDPSDVGIPKIVKDKIGTHSFRGFINYAKDCFIKKYKIPCEVANCYTCMRN